MIEAMPERIQDVGGSGLSLSGVAFNPVLQARQDELFLAEKRRWIKTTRDDVAANCLPKHFPGQRIHFFLYRDSGQDPDICTRDPD